MQNIRIIEIPSMKAVYSGPLTDEEKFEKFNRWFSEYHASLTNELYPRDFMWYNERIGAQEWFYALPAGAEADKITDFEIVDLPSGLFAVASCLDADLDQAADWLKTREELIEWVNSSERFKLYQNEDGKAERYPMFHIVSPGKLIPKGISVEDLYLPIEEKSGNKTSVPVRQSACIKTERLELKSYRSSDKAQMTALLTNPEITNTFMVPDFQSEEQVLDLVCRLIAFSSKEDTAHLEYGIYWNDTLIGFVNDCGITDDEIEIGYVIHPDYKGWGFATEAVTAVIQDLFRMGFNKITAGFFEENISSRRVMEKCGMRQISKYEVEEYRGENHICRYFEITNSPEGNG